MIQENLQRLAVQEYQKAYKEYQALYKDSIAIDDPLFEDLIPGILAILAGRNLNKINPAAKKLLEEIFGDYEGLEATVTKQQASILEKLKVLVSNQDKQDKLKELLNSDLLSQLNNNREYKDLADNEKAKFLLNDSSLLTNTLVNNQNQTTKDLLPTLFFNSLAMLGADLYARTYVGVVTKNDDRVRPEHRKNHMKYWLKNTRKDFSKDFRCRCFYLYGTKEFLEEKGFKPY